MTTAPFRLALRVIEAALWTAVLALWAAFAFALAFRLGSVLRDGICG